MIFYVSEFSKETYKTEYEICNLKSYLQKTKGENTERNLILLRNLISKLDSIHSKYSNNIDNSEQAHLNISVHNIYFNEENDVFYGPIRLGLEEDDLDLWYSAIEHLFSQNSSKLNIMKSDIWSIGCIVSEMFFLATPLFQCVNSKDKLRKIIEVIMDNVRLSEFQRSRIQSISVKSNLTRL
jgi:serine/threonine protein kinase